MTTATNLLLTPVTSSAIAALAVTSGDAGAAYLLVQFNSNLEKVYRYAFEDDITSGAARRWFDLLQDAEARSLTSWGSMLHRALKHGDIEPIEV